MLSFTKIIVLMLALASYVSPALAGGDECGFFRPCTGGGGLCKEQCIYIPAVGHRQCACPNAATQAVASPAVVEAPAASVFASSSLAAPLEGDECGPFRPCNGGGGFCTEQCIYIPAVGHRQCACPNAATQAKASPAAEKPKVVAVSSATPILGARIQTALRGALGGGDECGFFRPCTGGGGLCTEQCIYIPAVGHRQCACP
jgi:hypothetical protein